MANTTSDTSTDSTNSTNSTDSEHGAAGKPRAAAPATAQGARDAPAPATAPPAPAEALATARQVEELADRLSACADSIHARVMRDIHRDPGEVPETEKTAARALLDAEQVLRQRADGLYADAASCIVSALGQSQQQVIGLTADAAIKIKTITRISDDISLVGRLLGLAAAAATGQVGPILLALKALKAQLDVVALHNPPAPATAPADSDPDADAASPSGISPAA